MIVATRALHAQTEHGVAGHVCNVIENRGPLRSNIALVVFVYAKPEIADTNQCIGIGWPQFIGRDLLH